MQLCPMTLTALAVFCAKNIGEIKVISNIKKPIAPCIEALKVKK